MAESFTLQIRRRPPAAAAAAAAAAAIHCRSAAQQQSGPSAPPPPGPAAPGRSVGRSSGRPGRSEWKRSEAEIQYRPAPGPRRRLMSNTHTLESASLGGARRHAADGSIGDAKSSRGEARRNQQLPDRSVLRLRKRLQRAAVAAGGSGRRQRAETAAAGGPGSGSARRGEVGRSQRAVGGPLGGWCVRPQGRQSGKQGPCVEVGSGLSPTTSADAEQTLASRHRGAGGSLYSSGEARGGEIGGSFRAFHDLSLSCLGRSETVGGGAKSQVCCVPQHRVGVILRTPGETAVYFSERKIFEETNYLNYIVDLLLCYIAWFHIGKQKWSLAI